MVTAARKNFLLRGRNLKQNLALGGRLSALTGWIKRDRGRERGGERQTDRDAATTIITITTIIVIEI